jgi:hypothetical protein
MATVMVMDKGFKSKKLRVRYLYGFAGYGNGHLYTKGCLSDVFFAATLATKPLTKPLLQRHIQKVA